MSQRMGAQAHRWVLNELDSHLPSSLRVKKMPDTVGPRAQSEAVETVPGNSGGREVRVKGRGCSLLSVAPGPGPEQALGSAKARASRPGPN